jgi:signal transduction histidine kinase
MKKTIKKPYFEKLELSPEKARAQSAQKAYHLNVVQIPLLRFLGFSVIALFVLLHQYYVSRTVSWYEFFEFFWVAFLYAGASWAVLYGLFGKTGEFDLGFLFLSTDVLILVYAIYLTGGQESILFFLLLLRVADQSSTTSRRVLWFIHISILAYVLMLFYLSYGKGERIVMSLELPKICMLYLAGLYISLAARPAENLRKRVRESLRLARTLIIDLEGKTEQLSKEKSKAEAANSAKSEFLTNISHEIRTPMNGILGMTDLVLESELNEEQREYLDAVKTSAQNLLGLLGNLVDLSKIEDRSLVLEETAFDLQETLNSVLMAFEPKAKEKGIDLKGEILKEVAHYLHGDPLRLHQILSNLVDNGIKFAEKGTVSVKISKEETLDSKMALHLAVSDTGIGIPADKRKDIFDLFFQVDGSSTRKAEGVGIGLALTKRIVDKMNGKIWVDSVPGAGSTFHVVISLKLASEDF